MVVQQN